MLRVFVLISGIVGALPAVAAQTPTFRVRLCAAVLSMQIGIAAEPGAQTNARLQPIVDATPADVCEAPGYEAFFRAVRRPSFAV